MKNYNYFKREYRRRKWKPRNKKEIKELQKGRERSYKKEGDRPNKKQRRPKALKE